MLERSKMRQEITDIVYGVDNTEDLKYMFKPDVEAIMNLIELSNVEARIDELFIETIGGSDYTPQEVIDVQKSIRWGDQQRKRLVELERRRTELEEKTK